MTFNRRHRAETLLKMALIVAPPERRDWVTAMQAEVAHLPDSAVQSFAWGCLWATVRARAGSPAFIVATAQWVLVLGAISWSAGNIWLAGRLSGAGASSPTAVANASAAIYASGALLTAMLGLRATVILVTPLLLLVGLVATGAEILLPSSEYNGLYQALAVEQFSLLAVVLLIAVGVPRWVAAREGTDR
jgi:hypothetical protein